MYFVQWSFTDFFDGPGPPFLKRENFFYPWSKAAGGAKMSANLQAYLVR
jgi:hypothetical protein